MSLEQAIKENTDAINKLVAIFSRYVPTEAAAPAPAAEEPKAEKPAKKAKAAPAAEPEAAAPAPVEEPVAAAKPAAPAASSVGLPDLQKLGLKIQAAKGDHPEGMERLKAALATHGGAKLSTLPTDAYAAVYAEMESIIADLGI